MNVSDPKNPLTQLVAAKRENAPQRDATAKLAEAHRVWAAAFNKAGGGLAELPRELPQAFLVEVLARAHLHDSIALACDGADCGLLSHTRQQLVLLAGEQAAHEAGRALLLLFSEDRAAQARMRELATNHVVDGLPPANPPANDNGG